jgi:hypothetical protein
MERSTTTILLLIGLAISVTIWGCQKSRVVIIEDPPVYKAPSPGPPPWAPAHGHRAKYRYYYYPATYVYFDVGRSLYFYYQNNQWLVSASLPVGIRIAAQEYVVLEMDHDKPYIFHSDVVKRYPPGQLKKSGKGKGKDKWD